MLFSRKTKIFVFFVTRNLLDLSSGIIAFYFLFCVGVYARQSICFLWFFSFQITCIQVYVFNDNNVNKIEFDSDLFMDAIPAVRGKPNTACYKHKYLHCVLFILYFDILNLQFQWIYFPRVMNIYLFSLSIGLSFHLRFRFFFLFFLFL